jgi:hypothetical protein
VEDPVAVGRAIQQGEAVWGSDVAIEPLSAGRLLRGEALFVQSDTST